VVSGSLVSPVFKAGGVGGAVHNSFPSPNRQGITQLALRAASQKLQKNCGHPLGPLSNSGHTGHMEPTKPQRIVWIVLAAFMVVGWALIIWVATEVTQTALDTLSYIVELAQMP
jgi:hypothetical protein